MTEAVAHSELFAAWRGAESHCIKCGFCLPVCPTYRETGSESASPRGRLELMYAAARDDLPIEEIRDHLGFCLGCLACETACPSGIRFGTLLEAGRADALAAAGPSWRRPLPLLRVVTAPALLQALAWGLWLCQVSRLLALLRFSGLLLLAPPLARLERSLPPLPMPQRWRPGTGHSDAEKGERRVLLFSGCVMDAVFGAVHAATVKVLRRNGFVPAVPPEQACCGALHQHEGERAGAVALARRNIAAFEQAGEAPILVNSAGCGAFLKSYAHLLADDPDWKERAARVAERVRDINEFLAAIPLQEPQRPLQIKVAYDDACHLLHAQQIGSAPRDLLRRVPGLELVPLEEADWCCGSAGSYGFHHPAMAARLLSRKMEHIAASGAQVVATGNPGCLLQLRLGAERHRMQLHVLHPVELLAKAYE
jgi:glycolate oxidase iron-sulfur subunit